MRPPPGSPPHGMTGPGQKREVFVYLKPVLHLELPQNGPAAHFLAQEASALRAVKGGPNPRRIAVGQNPALSIGHRQIDNAVLSGGVLHQGLEIIRPSSVHAHPDAGACFQSPDKGISVFQKF